MPTCRSLIPIALAAKALAVKPTFRRDACLRDGDHTQSIRVDLLSLGRFLVGVHMEDNSLVIGKTLVDIDLRDRSDLPKFWEWTANVPAAIADSTISYLRKLALETNGAEGDAWVTAEKSDLGYRITVTRYKRGGTYVSDPDSPGEDYGKTS